MSQFYVYVWFREGETPLYVGKGQENRAYVGTRVNGICPPAPHLIQVLEQASEEAAFETERELIKLYGRKNLGIGNAWLRNLTDGGEGPSLDDDHRRKISEACKKAKDHRTPEHNAKIGRRVHEAALRRPGPRQKICPFCSKSFSVLPSTAKSLYCNKECWQQHHIQKRTRICPECGVQFVAKVRKQKLCSHACRNKFFPSVNPQVGTHQN